MIFFTIMCVCVYCAYVWFQSPFDFITLSFFSSSKSRWDLKTHLPLLYGLSNDSPWQLWEVMGSSIMGCQTHWDSRCQPYTGHFHNIRPQVSLYEWFCPKSLVNCCMNHPCFPILVRLLWWVWGWAHSECEKSLKEGRLDGSADQNT